MRDQYRLPGLAAELGATFWYGMAENGSRRGDAPARGAACSCRPAKLAGGPRDADGNPAGVGGKPSGTGVGPTAAPLG